MPFKKSDVSLQCSQKPVTESYHARCNPRPSYPPWSDPSIFSGEHVCMTKLLTVDTFSAVFIRNMPERRYFHLPTSWHGGLRTQNIILTVLKTSYVHLTRRNTSLHITKRHSVISIATQILALLSSVAVDTHFSVIDVSLYKSWALRSETHVLRIVQAMRENTEIADDAASTLEDSLGTSLGSARTDCTSRNTK